jgi:hypothetical protein
MIMGIEVTEDEATSVKEDEETVRGVMWRVEARP